MLFSSSSYRHRTSLFLLKATVVVHPFLLLLMLDGRPRSSAVVVDAAFYMHRSAKSDFLQAPSIFEDEPVVVEDVLSPEMCSKWLNHILVRSQKEEVALQHQNHEDANNCFHVPLSKAVDTIRQESSFANPLYATSLKSSCSTDQLPVYDTLESLFVNEHTGYDDAFDWLSCFANHMHIHDTLSIAGTGATSPSIQCHPFTKFHLTLGGSQLWRILPPDSNDGNVHDKLQSLTKSKLTEQSWEGLPICMGYEARSDVNLFAFRHRDVQEPVYHDFQDSDKEYDDDEELEEMYDDFQHWAEDCTMLVPNLRYLTTVLDSPLQDGRDGIFWHSTVTLPGDVLAIPPGWWYQSFHLEPVSFSIQSQRCGGSEMGLNFIKHVLSNSGITTKASSALKLFQDLCADDDYFTPDEAQGIVDNLFLVLEKHHHEEKKSQ